MPTAVHLPMSPRPFLKKASPSKELQPFGKKIHTPKKLIKLKLIGFQHLEQEMTGA